MIDTISAVAIELQRRGYQATMELDYVSVLKYGLTFNFGTANGKWDGDVEAERSGGTVSTKVPADCTDVQRIADALAKAMRECAPGVTDPDLSQASWHIFTAVCEAMQDAEEIWGPGDDQYEPLMRAIAAECNQRIANFQETRERSK